MLDIANRLQDKNNKDPLLWDKVKMLIEGEIIIRAYEYPNSTKIKNIMVGLNNDNPLINGRIYKKEYRKCRWIPSVSNRYKLRKTDILKRSQKEWDRMLLRREN